MTHARSTAPFDIGTMMLSPTYGDDGRHRRRGGRFRFRPTAFTLKAPQSAIFTSGEQFPPQGCENAPGGRFRPKLGHAGNILQIAQRR